jgi:hypothetical protein
MIDRVKIGSLFTKWIRGQRPMGIMDEIQLTPY